MQPELMSRIQRAAMRMVERGATAVYVFGSAATGEDREDSDVDIAVSGLPPTVFFRAMAEASRIVGKDVDLFALEDDELSRSLASSGDLQRVL